MTFIGRRRWSAVWVFGFAWGVLYAGACSSSKSGSSGGGAGGLGGLTDPRAGAGGGPATAAGTGGTRGGGGAVGGDADDAGAAATGGRSPTDGPAAPPDALAPDGVIDARTVDDVPPAMDAPVAADRPDGSVGDGSNIDRAGDGGTGAGGSAPSGSGAWQSSVPLASAARQELGVATLGKDVYAIGGHSTLVDAFDTQTGQWRSIAALPAALDHCNVAAVGGKVYLVGATEAEKTIAGDVNAFLVFDPATNRWTRIRPMPAGTERAASGVAVNGTKIYVVGGWKNYGTATPYFSAYDTATDSWEVLPDIAPRRDHLVAGAVQGVVYAVGGRNGTIGTPMDRVDAFNIATKQWSARAPMITARGGTAGIVLFDQIYVFGGEGNPVAGSNGVFANTEVYDPANDTWRELAPMKVPKHGIGAGAVAGKVYFPGGATKQGGNAQVASMEIFIP
jgi:N-acetylneuraminic acid mutarotase